MKHMEPQVRQAFQSLPKSAFSDGYDRVGFESKMTKREAALILGVSATANKGKIRDAHQQIRLLNHPDKGGSPYIAAKIHEAKDLLEGQAKKLSKCMTNFKFILVYVYEYYVFIIKYLRATI
uniref:mitochondrial import inner membrane translocase subunit TIM14-like n=1 Tax=Callithrix jacchus TaxID=9483 RepID=UPI00159D87B2|nr:mitochondrial import inner membrane translocase subunit TIM14-like [Callithrix jacchus]